MRKRRLLLLLLPLAVLATAWVGPRLLDWEAQRDRVAAIASARLGRHVTLEGPLRLTLLGAAMTYVDGFILHRHAYFLVASVLCLSGSGLGTSVRDMNRNTADFVKYWFESIFKLAPKTAAQWGVVSVVGAFVLLAMGAGLSLLKGGGTQKGGARFE